MKMKPFDLAAAKAGAKVITRDKRNGKYIGHDEDKEDGVAFSIENQVGITSYFNNGKCLMFLDDDLDLFMAPVIRTMWVQLYRLKNEKGIRSSIACDVKEWAIDWVDKQVIDPCDLIGEPQPIQVEE